MTKKSPCWLTSSKTKTPSRPEESATGQLLKEQVKDMLGALTEREQKILKLRFGLEDGKQHTLEEVGQEFSVTRERIRQIEAKALAKLRKHKDARKLHDYINRDMREPDISSRGPPRRLRCSFLTA